MDDGVIFNYRGSWCAEGLPTAWESEWRAVGERGTVKWDGKDDISGEYAVKTEGFSSKLKKFTVPSPKLKLTGHAGVIREFLNCVKSGGTPQTVCTDNIKSLAMVLAAIESAETGKKVTIKY
jgi:predicted dehydrogenase